MTQDNRTLTLRALDIPTIHKFGIGFDSMLDELMRTTSRQSTNYPPHNILKIDENNFVIQLAVAGFDQGDVDIQVEGQVLSITGSTNKDNKFGAEYLVQGISMRDFERTFTLAEHVEVKNAEVTNGILSIELERIVPLEKMPKKIDIKYNK
jgi:molecular chaperone IbpA